MDLLPLDSPNRPTCRRPELLPFGWCCVVGKTHNPRRTQENPRSQDPEPSSSIHHLLSFPLGPSLLQLQQHDMACSVFPPASPPSPDTGQTGPIH